MGDRCYMRITCRREHVTRFEELGFSIDHDDAATPCVELEDTEANYAHYGNLPTDIPWFGHNGGGSAYGASQHACDGQAYSEAGIDGGDADGFVIAWDYEKNQPEPDAINRITRHVTIRQRAEQLVRAATWSPQPATSNPQPATP